MDEKALLPAVVLEPRRASADATVIWLHGLGADGHDFEPVVPHLGLPRDHRIRFVFPHAPAMPVTINFGMSMPAWYDISHMDAMRHDEVGLRRSSERIAAWIAHERERGIDSQRIVLAGFSQGGAVALHLGLRHNETLAGILLLSTYMMVRDKAAAEQSEANRTTPVFQAHGTRDPMVPFGWGEAARESLRSLGHEVEWHEYPIQHEVSPQELLDMGTWLAARLPALGSGS